MSASQEASVDTEDAPEDDVELQLLEGSTDGPAAAPATPSEAVPPGAANSGADQDVSAAPASAKWIELVKIMGLTGLTSFGGPQAHMALFQRLCVEEHAWISMETYGELFGLSSSIPGATSSQLCFALCVSRIGILAGCVGYALFCWVGFTMMLLIATLSNKLTIPWYLIGLEVGASCAALALVAMAAISLASKLCTTQFAIALAFVACVVCMVVPVWFIYSLVILLSGVASFVFHHFWPPADIAPATATTAAGAPSHHNPALCHYPKWAGVLFLLVFGALFGLLFLLRFLFPAVMFLKVVETFFRMGSFVVGGAQVVLPMIDREFVGPGIMDQQTFFDGFAAVSLAPGPMFNFSVFYGTRMGGPLLGVASWLALNAPGFFVMLAALPFFNQLRSHSLVKRVLIGINACAVGLIAQAFLVLFLKLMATTTGDMLLRCSVFVLCFGMTFSFSKLQPHWVILSGATAGFSINVALYLIRDTTI